MYRCMHCNDDKDKEIWKPNKEIITCYNIKWDTDEPEDLPTEVTVPCEVVEEAMQDDDFDEYISDWLTDEYGFCHGGFEIKSELRS